MARWLRKLTLRARSLFRPRQVESELDDELRFHLETRIAQGVARGLSPEEARRRAAIALEGIEQQKEACRETWGLRLVNTLLRDVRHGARVLRAQPGFTLAAILSLALGIGANTAIFQVINAVRLRSLPVARPHELAEIQIIGGNQGLGISNGPNAHATYPLWQQIRANQRAFARVFAWSTSQIIVDRGADAKVVRVLWVTGETFPSLEIRPAIGRLLNEDDDRRQCVPGLVLSHAYWQSRFGADRAVAGRTLQVLNQVIPIVGVTPEPFFGMEVGARFDIAMPACMQALWGGRLDRRDWFWLSVAGRLKPGWTVERAAADIHALSGPMFEATVPADYASDYVARRYREFRLTAVAANNGVSELRAEYTPVLWILLGMTGLVLVLACANIMNLLLARATVREHEVAVRLAIGASRGRVVTQLLIESVLIASGGALLGGAVAPVLSVKLVGMLSTPGSPLYLDLQPDWRMFGFTTVVAAAACLLFGLLPAVRAAGTRPNAALKSGGRGLTATGERLLAQRTLIVAQVVVSLVLVFGALLFARSLRNLANIDLGINARNLIGLRLNDPSSQASPEQAAARHDELLQTVRALPGVASAASTSKIPMDPGSWSFAHRTSSPEPAKEQWSRFTYISSGYFSTVGTRLLAGRDIADSDRRDSRPVLVVNESFVRRHLVKVEPLGAMVRTVAEPGYPETVFEVVGVAADAKYNGLRIPNEPVAYIPWVQHPLLRGWPALVIRPSGPSESVIAQVRRTIADRHPNAVMNFSMVDEEIGQRLVRERVMAWLAGAFGVLAALLAFIGIYGVISYLVQRRRHEMAIRLALGAGRARIVHLIARQLAALVAAGLAIGLVLSLFVARGAGALLFGVTARDPLSLAAAFAVLAAIAAIACAIPALRASRFDTSALRSE
jgi:predicted permease